MPCSNPNPILPCFINDDEILDGTVLQGSGQMGLTELAGFSLSSLFFDFWQLFSCFLTLLTSWPFDTKDVMNTLHTNMQKFSSDYATWNYSHFQWRKFRKHAPICNFATLACYHIKIKCTAHKYVREWHTNTASCRASKRNPLGYLRSHHRTEQLAIK